MILVPQKCVGVLQLFPVNVDLFSSPCSLTVSAWHSFLASVLLRSAGVSPCDPRPGFTTHPVPSWRCAQQLETHFQPATTGGTSHISRDNWLHPGAQHPTGNTRQPPELPGRSYLGKTAFATCAFKFILLLQSFH